MSWLDSRARDRAMHKRASSQVGAAPQAAHGHGAHGGGADEALPGSELWLAVSRDGGVSFQEVAVLDRDVCPCCRTGPATGPDGSVYVVWRKIFEGDVRDVAIARSTDGGRSFGAPSPVHRDGWVFPGCPHAGPSIAIAEDGGVHVAWYTGKDGGQGTFYASSADGGRSFSHPLALLTGDWVPPSLVRVVAEGSRVWAAWDDRREEPANRQVFLARIEDGRLHDQRALRGTTPDLAVAASTPVLAWQQARSIQLRIGKK